MAADTGRRLGFGGRGCPAGAGIYDDMNHPPEGGLVTLTGIQSPPPVETPNPDADGGSRSHPVKVSLDADVAQVISAWTRPG
jgi:hypothetical protein